MVNRQYDFRHQVRAVGGADGPLAIEGLAAVYYDGTPDTEFELWPGVVERMMPGAFERAIAEDDVLALFNHEPSQVLGRNTADTLTLSDSPQGLAYRVEPSERSLYLDVVDMLKRREVTGSSIGFNVKSENWRKEDDIEIREITDVRLFDVGPVTFPAYTSTTAEAARSRCDQARASLEAMRRQRDEATLKIVRAHEARLRQMSLLTLPH